MGRVDGLVSNLNLDGATPGAVQPVIGDWGPDNVSTHKRRRWGRWWSLTAFLVLGVVVFAFGYWVFTLMSGG